MSMLRPRVPKALKAPQSQNPTKVSEMLIKVAGDFIAMGETLEKRRNLLRMACSAWNIASNFRFKREESIKHFLKVFKDTNDSSEDDLRAVEEDFRTLIQQKDELFPDVHVQILDTKISLIDGKEHLVVASIRENLPS